MAEHKARGLAETFVQVVKRFENQPAIVCDDTEITYGELHEKALSFAQQLKNDLPEQHRHVGILAPRGIGQIVAQVAITYAGGICVPLDDRQSDEHLTKLLDRLDATLVVVAHNFKDRLPSFTHAVLDHAQHPRKSPQANGMIHREEDQFKVSTADPTHCCHVYHTSGTTGIPKAVQLRAEGLINLAFTSQFRLTAGQRLSHAGEVNFDISLWEIWIGLLSGCTLIIVHRNTLIDPPALSRQIQRDNIQAMILTPAVLSAVVSSCPDAFNRMDTLMTGGEAVNMATFKAIFEHGAPRRILNLYGPTETSMYVIGHEVREDDVRSGIIPIGKGVPNVDLFLVNENLELVKPGEAGELLVGGAGVSQGYHGLPDANKKAFVMAPHLPRTTARGPEHLYRTGDYLRLNEDGEMMFMGRRDNQVKIRGQRIELEAIEVTLLSTQIVSQAAALVVQPEDLEGSKLLVAYVVCDMDQAKSAAHLIHAYKKQAPNLMVPRIEFIDKLPLSPTGKMDRKGLEKQYLQLIHQTPDLKKAVRFNGGKASMEMVRETMKQIWLGILALPSGQELDAYNDFFHLGGSSIQTAHLVARIRNVLGVELTARAIYENSTLEQMCQLASMTKSSGMSDRLQNQGEVELMQMDSKLGTDITPLPGARPTWCDANEGRVFLTGATGFVGAFMLMELLDTPHVIQIACMVRCISKEAGAERISQNLRKYGLRLRPEQWEKIHIVPGDLSHPQLGLSETEYNHWASWSSTVFHMAAHVNYVQPYSTHRSANTLGTLHMIEFSNTSRPKVLHYSSSLAVYGPAGYVLGAQEISENERPLNYMSACQYDSGYSQSQLVAEQIAWNAIDKGLPVIIYRLGFVLGHSSSGLNNTDDFVSRLFQSCISLGCYPILESQRKEFVPVDYVVSAIGHIAASSKNLGQAYNLIPPNPDSAIDLDTTFKLICDLSRKQLKPVPYNDWVDVLASQNADDALFPVMPMLREKVFDGRTRWELHDFMAKYGVGNIRQALSDRPELLEMMPMEVLFERYMRSWYPILEET